MADTATLLPVYLTPAEKSVFAKLPANLREQCNVQEEQMTFEDTDEQMAIRMRNMQLSDPKLLALKDKLAGIKTQKEFQELAATVDLSTVAENDLLELYFALGSSVLTPAIEQAFPAIADVDGVQALASLTTIRHAFLQSQQTA